MGEIVTDETFTIGTYRPGGRRALLINPPQYWACWSQPAGLLRIATLLRERGYAIDFVDCMETDARGLVKKANRFNTEGKQLLVKRDNIAKRLYHFGYSLDELESRLRSLQPPDEIWITSIMTYWWESTRDVVALSKRLFPHATVLVGGIYATLAPEHAASHLGADVIFKGELREASQLPTDLALYTTPPSYAILATSRGAPGTASIVQPEHSMEARRCVPVPQMISLTRSVTNSLTWVSAVSDFTRIMHLLTASTSSR